MVDSSAAGPAAATDDDSTSARARPASAAATDVAGSGHTTARLVVCRGCCCGNPAKQPDVDHEDQLKRLRDLAPVRVVDCLGYCERSNVVIVRPPEPAAAVWLGPVRGERTVVALHRWVGSGAIDDVPIELELIRFRTS